MPNLTNIEFLTQVLSKLDAERPAGDELQGRTKHQERSGDFIRRLQLDASSKEGKARVLVTGQIGVGKSSELSHFFWRRLKDQRKTGFWIYCNLEKEEHPERCGATGVFLTILRDCWGATRRMRESLRIMDKRRSRDFYNIRDEIIERLIDWLKGVRSKDGNQVIFRFGGMDFPVWLTNKDGALALILGKAAQHEAVSVRSERFGLLPDLLVNLMNKLFEWIGNFHYGIPPLLIIDHVDKIRDETSAREVLLEVIPQWQRVNASIIMTAPYEYTLGDMRNSVEAYWGNPLMIYPLEFPELDDRQIPPFYLNIVQGCDLLENIRFESIRMLAHYCGGIPRTFVQLLIQASKEAHLAAHANIEPSDAQAVVFDAERAYQDYGIKELQLLDQISSNKIGLSSASTLLRSPIGLLVMPPEKGEHPIRIHPLAESVVVRYRLRLNQLGG